MAAKKKKKERKIPNIVAYLSCSAGCTHYVRTKTSGTTLRVRQMMKRKREVGATNKTLGGRLRRNKST